MDDKNKLLIAQLRKDSRRPIVALARDLDLSRTATQERLAKLVASGVISKFTIEECGPTGGVQSAHLLIKLEKGFKCAQVVPKLKALVAASVIHSVAGQHDILMRLDAQDMVAIEAAQANVAAISGVAEVVTLVALETHLG